MGMTFLNFVIAMAGFALLGAVGHVLRAVINLFPDRLSDKPMLDLTISDGYTLSDHLLQVDYDDFGYYRLDSRRNLVITVVLTMLGGFAMIALDAAASHRLSDAITVGLAMLADLLMQRLAELGLR